MKTKDTIKRTIFSVLFAFAFLASCVNATPTEVSKEATSTNGGKGPLLNNPTSTPNPVPNNEGVVQTVTSEPEDVAEVIFMDDEFPGEHGLTHYVSYSECDVTTEYSGLQFTSSLLEPNDTCTYGFKGVWYSEDKQYTIPDVRVTRIEMDVTINSSKQLDQSGNGLLPGVGFMYKCNPSPSGDANTYGLDRKSVV